MKKPSVPREGARILLIDVLSLKISQWLTSISFLLLVFPSEVLGLFFHLLQFGNYLLLSCGCLFFL